MRDKSAYLEQNMICDNKSIFLQLKPIYVAAKKRKKRQTSILEKYFFSEHVESF